VLLGAGILYGGLIYGMNVVVLPGVNCRMSRQLPLLDRGTEHLLWGALLGWSILIVA
jgi:hypothetical protein